MQDITLLQYLSQKLHTFVYKFAISGELLFSYCGVFSLEDSYMKDRKFVDFLLEKPSFNGPCLKSLNQDLIFCQVRDDTAIYILGPIRFRSPIYLVCNYQGDFIEVENQTIPYADILTYWDDIVFCYQMLCEEEITAAQIIDANLIGADSHQEIQENFNNLIFNNHENATHHNPYDQELREFSSIENGDLIQLQDSWKEDYDGTVGTLSKDPLRNMKDLVIVIVTLASRAAIRGGLSPEISFSLSDTFIQETENCNDIALVRSLALKAELQYASLVHELKDQSSGKAKKENNPRINKCKDYIFSHLHDHISLDDLAKEADCNPNYLSTLFKEYEGVSISTYILQEKINRAKNLLIYSDYSFIEIATYLGFSSQSHLGAQFKKITGCTLREYRMKHGKWN